MNVLHQLRYSLLYLAGFVLFILLLSFAGIEFHKPTIAVIGAITFLRFLWVKPRKRNLWPRVVGFILLGLMLALGFWYSRDSDQTVIRLMVITPLLIVLVYVIDKLEQRFTLDNDENE